MKATLTLLVASLALVPAAAAQHGQHADRLLTGYLPRVGLHSLSLGTVHQTLHTLADLLEETPPSSGEKRFPSRLYTPTVDVVSDTCRRHTDIFRQELQNSTLWAVLMLDATGKLPDGILAGNAKAFGNFDECLLIDETLDSETYPDLAEDDLHFVGRYVPVLVAATPVVAVGTDGDDLDRTDGGDELGAILLPTQSRMSGVVGMCVPSSCSGEDVRDGLQTLLGANVTVTTLPSNTKEDTVSFRAGDIVVITIMVVVGVLMAAGTAADLYHRRHARQQAEMLKMRSVTDSSSPRLAEMLYISQPAKLQQRNPPPPSTRLQALIAFSVYTNTKKLMDTTTSKSTLTCVHGIRFFSMTWVLIGHATSFVTSYDENVFVLFDWLKGPWFNAVVNAMPSVDTFYLLSGLLLSYGFFSVYGKRKFNILVFYVHRYLRLTPPLAIMIAFTATLFVYLGDGPLWGVSTGPQAELCQDYWWRDILYIQNFFSFGDMCLGQTWYLATDMQMFLFSPLVLFPLVWSPLFGSIWLCVLIAGFLALRVVIWSVKDLPPTSLPLNQPDPEAVNEMTKQYIDAWMRCTVWLTGIGLGYILHRLRGRQLRLKPWLWMSGWVAAFAMGISVVYGMTGYQMPWEPYSKLVAVSYGGLHRTAWGLAVAWVIFACVTGYGGVINTFLSYPGFIPLSRLTYAGYLVHINVIFTVEASVKGTMYVDVLRLIYRILAHIITTFAVAMPLSLAFEVPFINLEKMLLEPKKPPNEIFKAPAAQTEIGAQEEIVERSNELAEEEESTRPEIPESRTRL